MPKPPARSPVHLGWRWFAVAVVAAVAASGIAPAHGSELRESAIVKAVRRAKAAVVNIRGEKTLAGPATPATDAGKRVNGMGTGVVFDPRGYILTNYHVVDGVREIQVTMCDHRAYVATLTARDLETDLAIIKIDAPRPLETIAVGTSCDLMPGETVIAVGNAYGYENTVTRGIISALHRAVQVSDAQFYDDLIQTDAPINPGNSGGPLLNIDGDMIGINVAVRAGAQNIGFAIPVDKALGVAGKALAASGAVRVWHGLAAAADVPGGEAGLTVATVEKSSPAAESGIESGDIVTRVGDQDVKRGLDFHRAMVGRKPGETLPLTVLRRGEQVAMSLKLADLPAQTRPALNPAWDVLGLELQPIAGRDFRELYRTRYRGGLAVVEVRPDGPAAAQGIRPGDVLVGVHVWETISPENVSYILKRPDLGTLSPLKFYILRGNETLYGYLPLSVKTARRE